MLRAFVCYEAFLRRSFLTANHHSAIPPFWLKYRINVFVRLFSKIQYQEAGVRTYYNSSKKFCDGQ
jgi:hypothetical protein